MQKLLQVSALAALLFATTIPMAQAQSFYLNPNRLLDRGLGLGRYHHRFDRVVSWRENALNNEVASLRASIADRQARGTISQYRAARLAAMLDNVLARENALAASGRGLSAGEFAELQARLRNVRVAINGGGRFY